MLNWEVMPINRYGLLARNLHLLLWRVPSCIREVIVGHCLTFKFWLLVMVLAAVGPPLAAVNAQEVVPSFSKAALEAKDPREKTLKDFDQRRSIHDVIKEFAADPGIHQLMKEMNDEVNISEQDQRARWAAGVFEANMNGNERFGQVRDKFRQNSERRAAAMLVKQLGVDEYLSGGMEFDFDFFSGGGDAPKSGPPPQVLTYGLVVEEIIPATNQVLTARSGEISEADLKDAPKADVKYKVGPIRANNDAVYKISQPRQAQDSGLSTSFKGRIARQPGQEFSPSADGALPPMVMGLYQEQQLYRLEYRTNADFKKDDLYHGIKVPIRGTLELDREMDSGFNVTRTSAKGLLMEQGRPQVDVHYVTREGRYQGDFHLQNSAYDFTVRAHSSSSVDHSGPKYELGLSTDF